MEIEIQKWLYDAHQASQAICEFLREKDFEDYTSNLMLSSAVERQFEILGEALKRIRDKDEEFLETYITGWRGAISFRNILAHGYDHIDDDIVWSIVSDDLPELIKSIEKHLN
ncbi:MAG: HepT-like ribonuclease domain-containing protein [Verrucomicrobiota bacterium]